jgi:hypothetical protein
MISRALLLVCLTALSTVAAAQPLTIRMGESWVFRIADGQPAGAHKVEATAKPAEGEMLATVRAFLGTTLTVTNNSGVAYDYNAELLSGGKTTAARSCALPAKPEPTLEHWNQKADAVRIGNFRAAGTEGRC